MRPLRANCNEDASLIAVGGSLCPFIPLLEGEDRIERSRDNSEGDSAILRPA